MCMWKEFKMLCTQIISTIDILWRLRAANFKDSAWQWRIKLTTFLNTHARAHTNKTKPIKIKRFIENSDGVLSNFSQSQIFSVIQNYSTRDNTDNTAKQRR